MLRLLEPKEARPDVKQNATAGQPSRVVISELPDVCKLSTGKQEFLVPGLLAKGAITLITAAREWKDNFAAGAGEGHRTW